MHGQTTAPTAGRLAGAPERVTKMALTRREHRRLAAVLLRATREGQPIEPLSVRYPELTADDAAVIRDMAIADRVADGERVIGAKVALPARLGWLTNGMLHSDSVLDLADMSDPHVEPKLALMIAVPLPEPVGSLSELLAVADRIFPCLEVVSSSYSSDGLSATDEIADNCGAAKLIIGEGRRPPPASELANGTGELELAVSAGQPRQASLGPSSGSPEALVWLANAAVSERGGLEAGALLASPSWSDPAPLAAGTRVSADFAGVGRVTLTTR